MLANYIKIAFRNLNRNRLFSFINIFGLALSLSVCMMVMLRLKDQLDYDNFHTAGNRTFRVVTEVKEKNKDAYHLASSPALLEQGVKSNTSVEHSATVYASINHDGSYRDKSIKLRGAFTQPSFFEIFDFPLASGNIESLDRPNTVILSADAAARLFDREDPMGKMILLDKLGSYIVAGVLKVPSGKSHLYFDAYVSAASVPALEKSGILPVVSNSWDPFRSVYTYVRLKEGADKQSLQANLSHLSKERNMTAHNEFNFQLQAFDDITPGSMRLFNDISSGTSWSKIWTEIIIALLILFAGCFNYTNLTIARALTRAREVGIRKVAGARRSQVFLQYITESICMALLSLALGYVLLSFILEYKPFNDGYEFMPEVQQDLTVFILFFVFSIFTGLLAGSLPAWILSSFRPVEVLKNIRTRKLFGNLSLQKTLIVFQFSLSLILLIFLVAFYSQFSFLSRVETGFRSQNILTIPLNGADHRLVSERLANVSGVQDVLAVSDNFGKQVSGSGDVRIADGGKEVLQMNYYLSEGGLVSMMGLQLRAGSDPDPSAAGNNGTVLINEKALQALSLTSPEAAIGQVLSFNDTLRLVISGVVKDFYYQGAGNDIRPLLIIHAQGNYAYLNVWGSEKDEGLPDRVQTVWKQIYPHKSFQSYWLRKHLTEMNDQTASISLLGFLGLITITIGSLGLLGLVVYTIETRRKEISIRKVIGAGVQELILLLSRNFVRLLLISGLIALPLGYILSLFFLQNFANRTDFGFLQLMLCFLFLLLIGLTTIVSQTWKAAAANPAEHLRAE